MTRLAKAWLAVASATVAAAIFTIERAIALLSWAAQVAAVEANPSGGSYPTYPDLSSVWQNPFMYVFIVLACGFAISALRRHQS